MTLLMILGLAITLSAMAGLVAGQLAVRTWSALFVLAEALYTLDGVIHRSTAEAVISPVACAVIASLWWWRAPARAARSRRARGRRRRPRKADH